MSKICLITPPSPFLLDERVFMHIGILKVASSLESQGYKIDFLDLSGVENYLEVMKDYCVKNNDVKDFGLTASTPQVPFAVKIAKTIKENSNSSKVILGGPHVTLMNTASKREIKRGQIIMSEAETKQKRRIEGVVTSDSMDKTIVVTVTRLVKHPVVHKYVKRTSVYYAHDEENKAGVGDKVEIIQSRPLSKKKRWRLTTVLEVAK